MHVMKAINERTLLQLNKKENAHRLVNKSILML